MWGSARGWALGEEAVAKQPEMGNTAEAASPGGLVLSSRCHGGTSPLVLIRSQGSQGHDGKTRSGVAFRTGDFSTIFLVCLLWLPVCDCDVQGGEGIFSPSFPLLLPVCPPRQACFSPAYLHSLFAY